jgi:hypothetical protein
MGPCMRPGSWQELSASASLVEKAFLAALLSRALCWNSSEFIAPHTSFSLWPVLDYWMPILNISFTLFYCRIWKDRCMVCTCRLGNYIQPSCLFSSSIPWDFLKNFIFRILPFVNLLSFGRLNSFMKMAFRGKNHTSLSSELLWNLIFLESRWWFVQEFSSTLWIRIIWTCLYKPTDQEWHRPSALEPRSSIREYELFQQILPGKVRNASLETLMVKFLSFPWCKPDDLCSDQSQESDPLNAFSVS